jgi:hypothetical protein
MQPQMNANERQWFGSDPAVIPIRVDLRSLAVSRFSGVEA